ncbi:MAG TPA: phosphatase PAP2 family protein [Acidimicrobiales bacterium]
MNLRRTDWRAPALVLVLVGLVALGWVLGLVARHALSLPVDRPVLRLIVQHRAGWLTSLMLAVTNLGAPALLLVVIVGLGWAWWTWRRTSLPLVMLLAAWLGAEVLFNVAKLLVDRPRPPIASSVQHFGGLAFPSGHATQAAAVWGMVAVLAVMSMATRPTKTAVCAAAITIVVVVGLTRVYLGAHWTTDVLGGWFLGGAWTAAVVCFIGPGDRLEPDVPVADTTV